MVDTRSTRVCVYGKVKYHTATRDVSLNHLRRDSFVSLVTRLEYRSSFVSRRLVNTVWLRLLRVQWDRFSQQMFATRKSASTSREKFTSLRTIRVGGGEGRIEQRGKLKWTLRIHVCITSKDAIYFTRSLRAGDRPVWETQRRRQLCKKCYRKKKKREEISSNIVHERLQRENYRKSLKGMERKRRNF